MAQDEKVKEQVLEQLKNSPIVMIPSGYKIKAITDLVCKDCAHFHSLLEDSEGGFYHIHNYCDALCRSFDDEEVETFFCAYGRMQEDKK